MFRQVLILLSNSVNAQKLITRCKWVQRISRQYIAGETLEEAIEVTKCLNAEGYRVTIDLLGENSVNQAEAESATEKIIKILQRISEKKINANVSIKLTQLGLTFDNQICQKNLEKILKKASSCRNFIRFDMEDSRFTDAILNQYYQARSRGYDHLGVAIQSYLRRSRTDLVGLLTHETRVRLCKGAYREPESIAFSTKEEIDLHFDSLAEMMLQETLPGDQVDDLVPPSAAFATHDSERIEKIILLARLLEIPSSAFEFQLLYGIRRDLQRKLREQGYNVRIYVPFGACWYPYFMRRMAENPMNFRLFRPAIQE